MAGTATISTIKHDVTGAATTFRDGSGNEIGQLVKSWLQYNGSSPAIRGSFNVSSVTKNGTGDYTSNFTNAMTDGNYTLSGCSDWATAFVVSMNSSSAAPSSGSIRINNRTSGGTAADSAYIFITVTR